MNIKKLFLLFSIAFVVSCDRPACTNSNIIFDQFEPSSNEYKRELVDRIESIGRSNIKYWVAAYEKIDDKQYLVLNVQGEDLCALGQFEIKDPAKLETFIRNKGLGYRGAGVRGFEFTIIGTENINLVYRDLKRIID